MTKFATPTLADAGSNVVRPDAAAQQAEVARRAEQSGLSSVKNLFSAETIGSAYQLTPVAMAGWSATGFAYPPDPSFRLSPEQISEFIDGIDPAYAPMVTQARSAEHMAFLKGQAQELSRKRQVLADAGWGGSIAAVGSQILEPVNLSAMVAGNYAAAAAPFVTGVQAARASRLSRAVQNGFVQAGTSAAVEGVRNVVDPTAMPGASVANVLSDLAMGGAVGGLSDQARYVRALAGGAGAAAPQAAYIAVSDDVRTEEASSIMFWSLVMGGGFSAIAPATRLDNAIANAATEFDKKVDALTIHSMNLPLTRRGRAVLGQYAPDLATERANAQVAQMAGIEGPPRPVEVRSAATEVPTTPGVKQPWEMTAQEYGAHLIQRDGIDPKYVVSISENGSLVMLKGAPKAETRSGARGSIKDGINNRGNINAALLDAVNRNTDHPLTLPDGYVREGDYYVYRGTDAPPTPRSAATEVLVNRTRVEGDIADAFGKEATTILPVVDAYAKGWARSTGKSVDDYYAGLRVQKGGKPGEGALMQDAEKNAPVWYSKLSEVVDQKMGGAMDADQLKAMLQNNGVKPEELEWSQIGNLKGKVTKQQVLDHLAENAVQVTETTLGGVDGLEINSIRALYGVDSPQYRGAHEAYMAGKSNFSGTPKFSSYVTPGGSDYRELLLTLPDRTVRPKPEYNTNFDTFAKGRGYTDEQIEKAWRNDSDPLYAEWHSGRFPKQGQPNFTSSHFPDTPNPVAHVRINTRTDADGKKVLFIEEIQSDWHQKGREKGYGSGAVYGPDIPLRAISRNGGGFWEVTTTGDEFITNVTKHDGGMDEASAIAEARRRLAAEPHRVRHPDAVPDAPFKKSWHELAMKRMIRYAAENGYDRVAWTTGAMQAERYGLAKQVSAIHVGKEPSGKFWMAADDVDGRPSVISKGDLSETELADHVGKDLAKRAIGDLSASKYHNSGFKYEGVDLKIGGEGMKGFYDKMLVTDTNKLIKRHGAKVGEVNVETAPAEFSPDENVTMPPEHSTVHGFDVTPSMKQDALGKGMPLFQDARGSFEVNASGQRVIRALTDPNASTLPHEVGHDFLHNLPAMDPDLAERAAKALGAKSHAKIGVEHQEKFARGFEAYLRGGKAPSAALKEVFEKFKQWLTDIYQTIKGSPLEGKMNKDLRAVFDEMLTRGDVDAPPKPPAATVAPAAPIEPKVFYVPTDPYTKTQVGATNVGAAQAAATTPKPIDPKIDIYDFSNIHDGSTRFVGKVKGIPTIRFDQGALAGQSAISEYRALNNLFSTDPVSRMSSNGTETVAPFSLMESNVAHVRNVFDNEYMGKAKPTYEAWVKENAKTGIGNMGARIWGDANSDAFARAVADAIDTLAAGGTVSSPALRQAAMDTESLMKGQWKLMHHWGVEGVDQPNAPIANYVPHRYKRPAIDDLISKHAGNRDELIQAIGQQVIRPNLKARGTQTAADLDALADVFARAIIDKGGMPGVEDSFIHGLSSSDADDLIDQLGFTNDPVAAAHIRTYVAPEGGKPSFLQQRIPLNPLQSFTTSQGTFRMKDVMERNIFTLAHSYVRRSTGQASLAAAEPVFQKMYGTTDRISSPRAFSAYLQKKAKELQTTMGIAPEEANIARLEASYKAVAGLPMWTPGSRSADAWGSITRSVINMNFFRLMSNIRSAMNPMQDFAGAISGPDGTMGAAKRFFPDAFSIVTKMRTGQRPDAALIRTANEMGLGLHGNHFLSGIGDTEGYYHPILQQIENVTGTLARVGAHTSLQDVGQRFSERMTYNREAQSFLDLADTVLDERRVLQDGMTPAQAKVVQEQIKQHAIVKDGVLMNENFKDWTNPRAAWMYRMMMRRRVMRSLNLGDKTQQPLTIAGIPTSSPAGRMVSQFRRFPLMAQTNKIGAGLDRGSAFMAHSFISGGVSAMMAYSVGVYLDSIGRPDQQEYLDRMLSDEMIAKAAFGRNAMTALTPAAIDTLVAMTDNKPIFAPTRVTGLGQDNGALSLWTQNPTGDWFASALGSIAAFRAPIDSNYDFSQRNMRAIEGATWVPKAFGISNALRSMSSGLPERSKQDQ